MIVETGCGTDGALHSTSQEGQEGDQERGDGSTVEEQAEEKQSTTTARPSLTRSTLARVEKKLNHDFITCHGAVEAVINKSVETIIWLEDDVVLMDNFFSTLFSLLNFRRSKLQSITWLDIKLYAPPRLRGYGSVQNSATFPMLLINSSKKVVILNEISSKQVGKFQNK